MSRSIKKAIFKEGAGKTRKRIRKIIRRSQKNFMRAHREDLTNILITKLIMRIADIPGGVKGNLMNLLMKERKNLHGNNF